LIFNPTGGHALSLETERFAKLPSNGQWRKILASNEVRFGGDGAAVFEEKSQAVTFDGAAAILLKNTTEAAS
jgi:hypothetical protein